MAKDITAGSLKVNMGLNLANLSQDVGKATSILTSAEKNISSIAGNINKAFQAALVIGGAFAVKKLSDSLVELADKGDRASAIADNFEAMGGASASIDEARKRVLGVVDSFELMRIANTGLMRDIPGFNENFGLMAEYGNKLADALGGETAPAIDQVVQAFAAGKSKQLESIGIIIDTEQAYADFAKQIGLNAKQLDELQKKEAIQRAGLVELNKANKERGELAESVTQANERLNASMDEARIRIGQAINDNPKLTKAYNELAEALEKIDWGQLGNLAAQFFGIVISLATAAAREIDLLARGLNVLFGDNLQQQRDILKLERDGLAEQLENIQSRTGQSKFSKLLFGTNEEQAAAVQKQLVAAERNLAFIDKQMQANADSSNAASAANRDLKITFDGLVPPIQRTGIGAKALAEQQKESAKATLELATANQKFKDSLDDMPGIGAKALAEQQKESAKATLELATANQKFEDFFGSAAARGIADGLRTGIELALSGGKGEDYRASLSQALFSSLAAAADSQLPGSGAFVQAIEPLFAKGLEKIFGGENAGTTARKLADKFFADAFDADRLSVIIDGELVKIKDLVFKGDTLFGGDSNFNDGSFSGFFNTLPEEARRAFAGVGLAFEELLGVGDDIAGQLAAVFANNIGGSLNNLQLLVQSTGKSFEELRGYVEEAFLDGKIDALEAQSAFIGLAQVAEDGIPGAIGAVTEALDNFYAAGPKGGRAVIDAIKDIGFEAEELGLNFAAAQQFLINSGKYDAEQVNQIFQALRDNGIDTIEELTNATNGQLIATISQLQAADFPFLESMEGAEEKIDSLNSKLEGIDEHLDKELNIRINTEFDGNTQEALDSGLLDGTGLDDVTRGLRASGAVGNNQAVNPGVLDNQRSARTFRTLSANYASPNRRVGGADNFKGITINVDARGADRGVERDIMRALEDAEERIVRRTVRVVVDGAERGRFGGRL